jgi:hypothetical protein
VGGLPKTKYNYAYPAGFRGGGGGPAYPIAPKNVRAALSYAARSDTGGSSRTVKAAIAARYGSVGAGLAAASRYWRARGRR